MRLTVSRPLARTGDDSVISRAERQFAPLAMRALCRAAAALPGSSRRSRSRRRGRPHCDREHWGAASRVLPKHPIRRMVEQVGLIYWPPKDFSCVRRANIREHEG